jgi:hypothetical protein
MGDENARIRSLRPPKPFVDPWKAHGTLIEDERRPDGTVERALTIFLAGAECAFTCSFCDLWRYTIDGPTPPGALPKQIEDALATSDGRVDRIKLYNAANFFDRRAVPPADLPRIAELCAPFRGVTVESHASTIGPAALHFARALKGARLEVAMGLETIHPVASARLNKRLDLGRFDEAVSFLRTNDIDVRVFVLLGVPGVPRKESVHWAARTAHHAANSGASVIAIIPMRGGNGEMERVAALGEFEPPTLVELEATLDTCANIRGAVVTVDLWDVGKLAACPECRTARVERMHRINLTGHAEMAVTCELSS